MELVKSHRELRVYQRSFEVAMEIFKLTKSFPKEELYSLTDQIRRSSRSVSSNIAKKLSKNNIFRIVCAYFLLGKAHFAANSLRPIGKKCNDA